MSFWTYMLHCRGGYFYVGHTDDLDQRIGEHKSGLIPGFTAEHQPVELVWSDRFQTRDDAKAAETRLKGWSRAKKMALIRGDWERISALAKKQDSPSTSSGKTGKREGSTKIPGNTGKGEAPPLKPVHAELVEALSFSLIPHAQTASGNDTAILIGIERLAGELIITYRTHAQYPVAIPPLASGRADGLWQTTCFELFVRGSNGPAYREFNFSPSGQWAAYSFSSYREGMAPLELTCEPVVIPESASGLLIVTARLPTAALPAGDCTIGLSAVIEGADGTKSYWALAHPPGAPDFHAPACFAATLPAPLRT